MKRLLIIVLGFLASLFLGHHPLQSAPALAPMPGIDAQVRSFTPEVVLRFLKNPAMLQVQQIGADFDTRGAFDYVVAAYVAPPVGGNLLVFRNVAGKLQLAGGLDPKDKWGVLDITDNAHLSLLRLGQDGTEVLEVDNVSEDGQSVSLKLFRWTGDRLVSILPKGADTANAYLSDGNGTAAPKIITPPFCDSHGCSGYYQIYELKEGFYSLTATSTRDPEGGPGGQASEQFP